MLAGLTRSAQQPRSRKTPKGGKIIAKMIYDDMVSSQYSRFFSICTLQISDPVKAMVLGRFGEESKGGLEGERVKHWCHDVTSRRCDRHSTESIGLATNWVLPDN